VLVTCATEPDRFTATTTAFLEAAASLLAFSIARMASEETAQHAALHDGLTGLPNRAQLLEQMDRALDHQAERSSFDGTEAARAVIFLDIDRFKQVNDTCGHAAGDRVLIEAGVRLRGVMRPHDVLARLGGDEFVVFCEAGIEVATAIADRLLSVFADPFVIDDREVFLSASAGLALVGDGVTSDEVLADADIAMYQAKLTPGSAMVLFDHEMRAMADSASNLHNQLRRALERGQLRAVYQPVVDLHSGKVCAVEALLRWRHPDLGDVPAQQTVAAAERIGLAWELTCWIAGEAARTISDWNAANPEHPPLRLAVNFTPLLLGDPHRVAEFEAVVVGAGLPFALLDVELTETAFADPTPATMASMAELRLRGARLAMDDFGTGYSSLLAVVTLPLDVLKIDRSFVTPLQNGGDRLLVSAITSIARGRGLETIAEGIETHDQLAALVDTGCDLGQGYLFARPLEREQMEGLAALESGFADSILLAGGLHLLVGSGTPDF
jgi:diguanylate cyclase (GGDEF)-like protein